jgi:hypothetical protein
MRAASIIMAATAATVFVMSADTLSQDSPSSDTPSSKCDSPYDTHCMQSEVYPGNSYVVREVVCFTRENAYCELPKDAQEGKPCECPGGAKGKSGIHEETIPRKLIGPTVG